MQAVLCSRARRSARNLSFQRTRLNLPCAKRLSLHPFADDPFVTTFRNRCSRFSTPRWSVPLYRSAPPAKCVLGMQESGLVVSLPITLPNVWRVRTALPTTAAFDRRCHTCSCSVSIETRLGQVSVTPNRCQPAPTGYFPWQELASIGDVECGAAQ
jgi:hypothetical protein